MEKITKELKSKKIKKEKLDNEIAKILNVSKPDIERDRVNFLSQAIFKCYIFQVDVPILRQASINLTLEGDFKFLGRDKNVEEK